MKLEEAHQYYKNRIAEVRRLNSWGDAWIFLMYSAFIEYLVKLVYDAEKVGAPKYTQFIRDYLACINPLYKDFKYKNGECDLPEQMYFILRCGIVHSFSLIPDSRGRKQNARTRSILLGHEINGLVHLERFSGEIDAVVFTAEGLGRDLDKLVDFIFIDTIQKKREVKENIKHWLEKYPPINSL